MLRAVPNGTIFWGKYIEKLGSYWIPRLKRRWIQVRARKFGRFVPRIRESFRRLFLEVWGEIWGKSGGKYVASNGPKKRWKPHFLVLEETVL